MMLVEYYTGKRTYYDTYHFSRAIDRILLPAHGPELEEIPKKYIYLYRKDPIATVYSIMSMVDNLPGHRDHRDAIVRTAEDYGKHLQKYWVSSASDILPVAYEEIENRLGDILEFLDEPSHPMKIKTVCRHFSRDEVARITDLTGHGQTNTSPDYEDKRQKFREKHGQLVIDTVLKDRTHLEEVLDV